MATTAIQTHVSLRSLHTFGMEAQARYLASFGDVHELVTILSDDTLRDYRNRPLILGGGSNVLFRDNVDRLVLLNRIPGITLLGEDAEFVYVKAGAGVVWHDLVMHTLAQNWAGLENLALIPGCVGASPMQNIGAYGVEVKDVFESLEAWHLEQQQVVTLRADDCQFGYRESIFKQAWKNKAVILSVTFRLRKQPLFHTSYGAIEQELSSMGIETLTIQAIAEAVIRIRQSKLPDPAVIGNAGSFFKNPVVSVQAFDALRSEYPSIPGYPSGDGIKLAAGWLIEQAGFKGIRRGDAGVHTKQALVLVNYGHAAGKDIYDLSEEIIDVIKKRFHVVLQREVNILPEND